MTEEIHLHSGADNARLIAEIIEECWDQLDHTTRTDIDLSAKAHRVVDMANAGFFQPLMLRSAALLLN